MATRNSAVDHTATLNLASLLQQTPEVRDEVVAEGEFEPDEAWHSDEVSFEQPLAYQLSVRTAGGDDFILTGTVAGNAIIPCRRCLKGTEVHSSSELIYEMRYRPGAGALSMVYDDESGDDEVLVFGKPEVDFAQMLTEVFSVDLPLAVECPEGVTCEPLSQRYAERTDNAPSPFSSLEDFDVESKE